MIGGITLKVLKLQFMKLFLLMSLQFSRTYTVCMNVD